MDLEVGGGRLDAALLDDVSQLAREDQEAGNGHQVRAAEMHFQTKTNVDGVV